MSLEKRVVGLIERQNALFLGFPSSKRGWLSPILAVQDPAQIGNLRLKIYMRCSGR